MTARSNISSASTRRLAATAMALAVLVAHALVSAPIALAGSTFLKDVKAQNAHHFLKPVTLPRENKPPTLEREWEDKITRKSWQLSDGPISISVTLKKGGPPDGLLGLIPVLSLSLEGKKILSVEGSESFPDNPVFVVQIAEMDPGNPHREVVFSTYTGGAHCCSDTLVLTSSKDGRSWSKVELGSIDGEPLEVRDLNGDGRYEFAFPDNAFLYTFGCYACSAAPLHVLQLSNGKLRDVSRDPVFRGHQLKWLENLIEWVGDDTDMNGFLAGYVAQKILLGESAQAWKLMLKYYDRKGDWGLETCSAKLDDKGECPPGKKVVLSYPQALERFFKKNGYELKK